jgi:hypothetical protein
MSPLKSLVIGFMAITLAGCGQLVSEKLSVSSTASQPCAGKKLVILPFADYSYQGDAENAYRRNVDIMENLTARLTEKGFRLPMQDDLLKYLADNNIVRFQSSAGSSQAGAGYVQDIIDNDTSWSPEMKAELAKFENSPANEIAKIDQPKGVALDKATLAKIATNFNADLIMRGQIIKFDLGEENTWNPMKRGILPVVFSASNKTLFGVTNSEEYDALGNAIAGAAIGAAIGTTASIPYDSTEKINPERFNATYWGIGGAALGYMASKGGHANQAAVQLRLWLQDPVTGEVVWTNSVKVLVKPQTVFADSREEKLFDTAITQAIAALTRDMVQHIKPS